MLVFVTIEATSGSDSVYATYAYTHESLKEALDYAADFEAECCEYEEHNIHARHRIEVYAVDSDLLRIYWEAACKEYNLDQDTTSFPDRVWENLVRENALLSF